MTTQKKSKCGKQCKFQSLPTLCLFLGMVITILTCRALAIYLSAFYRQKNSHLPQFMKYEFKHCLFINSQILMQTQNQKMHSFTLELAYCLPKDTMNKSHEMITSHYMIILGYFFRGI